MRTTSVVESHRQTSTCWRCERRKFSSTSITAEAWSLLRKPNRPRPIIGSPFPPPSPSPFLPPPPPPPSPLGCLPVDLFFLKKKKKKAAINAGFTISNQNLS